MKTRLGKHPLIVGCAGSAAQLRRAAARPPPHCDLLEVRLDLTGLCGGAWPGLCAAVRRKGLPVLLTIRSEREGGGWRGGEAARLALYRAGLASVSAVDVEIGARALAPLVAEAHRRGVAVVGSFHDFGGTPGLARLARVEARGRKLGVDVVKIAAAVKTPGDLAQLMAVPAQATGPVCVLGMGPLGAVSRVALPCAGSCLAYGALGQATAPGQLSCRELAKELARWGARKE